MLEYGGNSPFLQTRFTVDKIDIYTSCTVTYLRWDAVRRRIERWDMEG